MHPKSLGTLKHSSISMLPLPRCGTRSSCHNTPPNPLPPSREIAARPLPRYPAERLRPDRFPGARGCRDRRWRRRHHHRQAGAVQQVLRGCEVWSRCHRVRWRRSARREQPLPSLAQLPDFQCHLPGNDDDLKYHRPPPLQQQTRTRSYEKY
ncbi:hypothetical protein PVAP13_5KG209914 [Panicum virgatum]|uniref:Uncharacterized protein n=1 Tax=Panicum virgatum TaxID=38727 RepID=A0A8T0SCD6_PANVG|nr:hypothetical protein PVAP13_5KG209914 [Panicum virgatum]KAG2596893.1 hypothetical protein PVAP13_5KG209914 [Panicum virgatum]